MKGRGVRPSDSMCFLSLNPRTGTIKLGKNQVFVIFLSNVYVETRIKKWGNSDKRVENFCDRGKVLSFKPHFRYILYTGVKTVFED